MTLIENGRSFFGDKWANRLTIRALEKSGFVAYTATPTSDRPYWCRYDITDAGVSALGAALSR